MVADRFVEDQVRRSVSERLPLLRADSACQTPTLSPGLI
jgi:hypothetical protein